MLLVLLCLLPHRLVISRSTNTLHTNPEAMRVNGQVFNPSMGQNGHRIGSSVIS